MELSKKRVSGWAARPPDRLMSVDLISRLREHFAWRCSLSVAPDHPYHTSVVDMVRKTKWSQPKVVGLLVTGTKQPSWSEFDTMVRALDISILDLIREDELAEPLAPPPQPLAPDAKLQALKTTLETISKSADKIIRVSMDFPGDTAATTARIECSRIHQAAEAIDRLYQDNTPPPKNLVPEY